MNKKERTIGQMPRIESALTPCVALLAHPDDKAAKAFESVFQDAAADWRLVRVADGSAAARHVMQKDLPELLITAVRMPKVSGPELVEWLRSFRGARPVTVIVYDDPMEDADRKRFLQNDISVFLPTDCPRRTLFDELSAIVARIEARKFATLQ